MENFNADPTTNSFETNESQLPVPTNTIPVQNDCNKIKRSSLFQSGIPLHLFIIGVLLILLVMSTIQIHQYKQYGKAIEQNAYVLSVSINLLEDNLLYKYGIFPEDIGFGELRSAWISNPCYETAIAYHDALLSALEYFESVPEPSDNYGPILV